MEELETPSAAPGKKANEWIADIVNKPSPGKGKKSKAPQQAGIVEDLNAAEEASFAVWCFFVDVNSMRTYLKAVWSKVGKGTIDLVTASVGMLPVPRRSYAVLIFVLQSPRWRWNRSNRWRQRSICLSRI